jgi:prepilin-type processing-associated H-X9-DG protein
MPQSNGDPSDPQLLGYSVLRPDRRRLHRILILGAFLVTGAYLFASVVLPMMAYRAREPALRVQCASNMKQIGLGAIMYANNNGGRFPPDLATIFEDQDVLPRVFVCPQTATPPPAGPTTQAVAAQLKKPGISDYIYVGEVLTTSSPDDCVVLYEPLSDNGGDGMNVLFADGHVEWVDVAGFQSILQQATSGVRPIRYPPAPSTRSATSQP